MVPTPRSRNQRPTKSIIAVLCVLALYGLAQPLLNSQLGWNLPSVMRLVGQAEVPVEADSTRVSPQTTSKPSSATGTDTTQPQRDSASGPLYGILKETRPNSEEYASPAGLLYTRGSAEGHRLQHLERHLEDQPTRPGKHGVFYGDMPQVLRWLDSTYERGKSQEKGTQMRNEDGRIVVEVSFDKPVGYVGGRDGKREGNPDSNRIRLVVDGARVITAFPY